MKHFKKFLAEMDDQMQPPGGTPPVNGGVKPSIPPEIATELSAIAQKLNALLEKLGIGGDQGGDEEPQPEKGLGDKGAGDTDMGNKTPGPPPNFQT